MGRPDGGGVAGTEKRWRVPAWALISASVAPLLLLVGPIVAGHLQPAGFNPVRDTISALAAQNASDRGVMTVILVCVGAAHVATAIGLVGAGLLGRIMLGVSGTAAALVALFPLPAGGRTSWAHAMFAIIAFLTLAFWPLGLVSKRWGPAESMRPFPARWPAAISATVVLFGLLTWFGFEQLLNGPYIGVSERIAGVAESTWPLVVVAAARVAQQKAQRAH